MKIILQLHLIKNRGKNLYQGKRQKVPVEVRKMVKEGLRSKLPTTVNTKLHQCHHHMTLPPSTDPMGTDEALPQKPVTVQPPHNELLTS